MTKNTKVAIGAVAGGVLVIGVAGQHIKGKAPTDFGGSYTVQQICEKYSTEEKFDSDNSGKVFEIKGDIAENGDVLDVVGTILFESSVKFEEGLGNLEVKCYFDNKDDLEKLSENYSVVISGKYEKALFGELRFKECELISYNVSKPTMAETTTTTETEIITEPSAEATEAANTEPTATDEKKEIVYIAASGGGVRYHCNKYCSGMDGNVREITKEEAVAMGKTPCQSSACYG